MIRGSRIQRAPQPDARDELQAGQSQLRGLDARSPVASVLEEVIEVAGVHMTLRPIRADDTARYEEFVTRLNPDDLRFRFGTKACEASRSELARMNRIDLE